MVNEMEVNINKSKYINVDYNGYKYLFPLNFTENCISEQWNYQVLERKFWKDFK